MNMWSIVVALGFTMAASALQGQKLCDVRQYGAKGDGRTKDTAAIQAAIDACSDSGDGLVRIAGGIS